MRPNSRKDARAANRGANTQDRNCRSESSTQQGPGKMSAARHSRLKVQIKPNSRRGEGVLQQGVLTHTTGTAGVIKWDRQSRREVSVAQHSCVF